MKLNDATIQHMRLDGVEYSTVREFVSKLEKAKRLSMSVYINTRLVCSGPVSLISDNNWIIASTNCQVSFTKSVSVESVVVRVKQDDVVLFESNTSNCDTSIPADDSLATFYVCLVNSSPYNELEKRVPESRFTPMPINRIPDTNFEDITSTLNDGADVTEGDSQEVDSPSTGDNTDHSSETDQQSTENENQSDDESDQNDNPEP